MPPPARMDYQASDWLDTAADEVTPTLTWSAGDFIVVVGVTENFLATLNVPTADGLTFEEWIAIAVDDSQCRAYVWTATAGSSGSSVITAVGTANRHGIAAFVYSWSGGRGNTASLAGSAATVIDLVRGSPDSAVIYVTGDWNGVQDTAVVTEPAANGTQRINDVNGCVSGVYAGWVNEWNNQGEPGTTSYGMTGHAGGVKMSGIAVEIVELVIAAEAAPIYPFDVPQQVG